MNYRHHFHAGNFADVMKHALLVQLMQGLQQKEKGFLFLDTHAGRGRYDLARAAAGDTLNRAPEWPAGIGRLWSGTVSEAPPPVVAYLSLIRDFDRRAGNLDSAPRFYPGSPWIGRALARPVDRLALCEKHPAECAALRAEMATAPRVTVQQVDGYAGMRAMLPAPERRALVLIDPPFEVPDEFQYIAESLAEGLQRMRGAVFAVWYPLTVRARTDEFLGAVAALAPPSALVSELTVAGFNSRLKMKGCGLLVLNPPWQFEKTAEAILSYLAVTLAQEAGGGSRVECLGLRR